MRRSAVLRIADARPDEGVGVFSRIASRQEGWWFFRERFNHEVIEKNEVR